MAFNRAEAIPILRNLSSTAKLSIYSSPFCVSSYNLVPLYKEFWVYSYQKPTQAPAKITFLDTGETLAWVYGEDLVLIEQMVLKR